MLSTTVLLVGSTLLGKPVAAAENCSPCNDQDSRPSNGDPSWDKKHPEWGPPYCSEPDYPNHKSEWFATWKMNIGGTEGPEALGPLGTIKTHQLVAQWCEGPPGDGLSKYDVFWMPLVNPDTIVFNRDLMAKVQAQLKPPKLIWLNIDKEHDWLWVRVEHFAAIEPIIEIFVDDEAGDDVTGKAYAFIRARPVKFTLSIPDVAGADGAAECDLNLAMSSSGCPITFNHSSSIDPSGEFTLQTEVVWEVESNSGKYDGLQFSRESTSTIAVAEAMAVSGAGGG